MIALVITLALAFLVLVALFGAFVVVVAQTREVALTIEAPESSGACGAES